jgi:hypothetical protein
MVKQIEQDLTSLRQEQPFANNQFLAELDYLNKRISTLPDDMSKQSDTLQRVEKVVGDIVVNSKAEPKTLRALGENGEVDAPKGANLVIGQIVRRRDAGKEWGYGYVTNTKPLLVTAKKDNPDARGYSWDEVAPMQEGQPLQTQPAQLNDLILQQQEAFTKRVVDELMGKISEKIQFSSPGFARGSRTPVSEADLNPKVPEERYVVRPVVEEQIVDNQNTEASTHRDIDALADSSHRKHIDIDAARTKAECLAQITEGTATRKAKLGGEEVIQGRAADAAVNIDPGKPESATTEVLWRETSASMESKKIAQIASILTPRQDSMTKLRNDVRLAQELDACDDGRPKKVIDDDSSCLLREAGVIGKPRRAFEDHLTTVSHRSNEADIHLKLEEDTSFTAVFLHDGEVDTKPYRLEQYLKQDGCAQAVVRSRQFQHVTTIAVCLNALWIGIEEDVNDKVNMYDSDAYIVVVTQLFMVYFLSEWLVRLVAFAKWRDAFRDGWFKFDTFLVVCMVLDTWVLMVILKVSIKESKSVPVPTSPLRVLRLLKLTRIARLMRAFPELITMIKSLVRSLRAIGSTCTLLLLLIYVWGILLHMFLKDKDDFNAKIYEDSSMKFDTVLHSMWLLVMNGVLLLDNAAPLMTAMMWGEDMSLVLSAFIFLVFVFLTAILVLQMLIGILCDLVSQVNSEQQNAYAIGIVRQELTTKLLAVDDDQDGHITQEELSKVINTETGKAVFKKLGINQLFFCQIQEMLFACNKTAEIKDVLDTMLLCRSDNPATVETLAGGFCFVAKEMINIQKFLRHQDHRVDVNQVMSQAALGSAIERAQSRLKK